MIYGRRCAFLATLLVVLYGELSTSFTPAAKLHRVATFLVKNGAQYSPNLLSATLEKTSPVSEDEVMRDVDEQATAIATQIVDDSCEVDVTGMPVDELCVDEEKKSGVRASVANSARRIGGLVSGKSEEDDQSNVTSTPVLDGDILEQGCKLFASAFCKYFTHSLRNQGRNEPILRLLFETPKYGSLHCNVCFGY